MALVVPALGNIFMVFADLESNKNWCNETYFYGFWFSKGGGRGFVHVWTRFVINV